MLHVLRFKFPKEYPVAAMCFHDCAGGGMRTCWKITWCTWNKYICQYFRSFMKISCRWFSYESLHVRPVCDGKFPSFFFANVWPCSILMLPCCMSYIIYINSRIVNKPHSLFPLCSILNQLSSSVLYSRRHFI